MGVPTSAVGYTAAMPRREDHEVHKGMWWGALDTQTPVTMYQPSQGVISPYPCTNLFLNETLGVHLRRQWRQTTCSSDRSAAGSRLQPVTNFAYPVSLRPVHGVWIEWYLITLKQGPPALTATQTAANLCSTTRTVRLAAFERTEPKLQRVAPAHGCILPSTLLISDD